MSVPSAPDPPSTVLQKQILRILAPNRSEESHFAGGLVLNAGDESPRYSHDFDIFHQADAEVARASDLDVLSLRSAATKFIRPEVTGRTRPVFAKRG